MSKEVNEIENILSLNKKKKKFENVLNYEKKKEKKMKWKRNVERKCDRCVRLEKKFDEIKNRKLSERGEMKEDERCMKCVDDKWKK